MRTLPTGKGELHNDVGLTRTAEALSIGSRVALAPPALEEKMANGWEQLGAKLQVGKGKGGKLVASTDAALDEFERSFNIKLPLNYRDFVKLFGPGELAGVVRIYAPVGRKQPGDLTTFVKGFREGADFLGEVFSNPKLILRSIPFANTIFGDMIVWDPQKPTDPKAHEYEVCLLAKETSKVSNLAPDFETFIQDRCLSPKLGKYLDYPDYKPENTFVPFASLKP